MFLGCTTGGKGGKLASRRAKEVLTTRNYAVYKRPFYTVVEGDTLTRIAWITGTTVQGLAAVNQLRPPYLLRINQRLIVPQSIARSGQTAPHLLHKNQPSVQRSSPQSMTTSAQPVLEEKAKKLFRWPAVGKRQYTSKQDGGAGIHLHILGKRGSPVLASASGRVMYAGNGLHGYRNLVIIKHDEAYISAYANNERSFVKEGEWVCAGQRIGIMGSTTFSKQAYLHFELRKYGKPVNPFDYIATP